MARAIPARAPGAWISTSTATSTSCARSGRKKRPATANAVAKFGPDGKEINKNLVDSDIRSLNSVRVDPAGNIYLALGARPGGKMLPPHLEGQLPNSRKDPDAESGHNYYPLMYGSIVKFGPEGGDDSEEGRRRRGGLRLGQEGLHQGREVGLLRRQPGDDLHPRRA